jgi:hypothetical protein
MKNYYITSADDLTLANSRMLTESYHASSQITAQNFLSCEQSDDINRTTCGRNEIEELEERGRYLVAPYLSLCAYLVLLPLQLGEVQHDAEVRRLHVNTIKVKATCKLISSLK